MKGESKRQQKMDAISQGPNEMALIGGGLCPAMVYNMTNDDNTLIIVTNNYSRPPISWSQTKRRRQLFKLNNSKKRYSNKIVYFDVLLTVLRVSE